MAIDPQVNTGSFLVDSYRQWIISEGVPLHEGIAVDLIAADAKPWARYGVKGAVVNVKGRGDFLDCWLLEIPPSRSTEPQRHICEAVGYVITGNGRVLVDADGGQAYTIPFGPRSMFAIPINARYRILNDSGKLASRIALTTSFPIMMNILRNDKFIFGTEFEFSERMGARELYEGKGAALSHETAGITRYFWESNQVGDLGDFDGLTEQQYRGKGRTVRFLMADSVLHGHLSEIPAGAYKKAHRHMGGSHIYSVTGEGYSLLWYEGDTERIQVNWHHGVLHSPPDNMYHQHFNLSSAPARYFAIKMGNYRYPITSRMDAQMRASVDVKRMRRDQIDYEDEDPAIRQIYERAMAARSFAERSGHG
jgi:uncharacterized RmlC-like cupin family protein